MTVNFKDNVKTAFRELTAPEELAAVRAIAASIWPETFASILSPAQIVYMMKMMWNLATV